MDAKQHSIAEDFARVRSALPWLRNQTDYTEDGAALQRIEEQLESAQREADIQMGEKLAAQMTLKAVCDALCLQMVSLGSGWTEATPKILARIEEIVDEAERGFRERDSWQKVAREYESALADRGAL